MNIIRASSIAVLRAAVQAVLRASFLIVLALLVSTTEVWGQWRQTNGPEGASIRSLFADGSVLYAGVVGGLHRSTDLGLTWTTLTTSMPSLNVRSAVKHEGDLLAVATDSGLMRSTDEGARWTVLKAGLLTNRPWPLLVHGDTFLLGGASGVHRSVDGGTTWELNKFTETSDTSTFTVALARTQTTTIAVTQWNLYKSLDDGITWAYLFPGFNPDVRDVFVHDEIILVAGLPQGIGNSTDQGVTWHFADLVGKSVTRFAAHRDTLYAASSEHGYWMSVDRGTTWQFAVNDAPSDPITSFAFIGDVKFIGTSRGVYRSTDGVVFVPAFAGIVHTSVSAFMSIGDEVFVGTTGSGIQRSSDGGETWLASDAGVTTGTITAFVLHKDVLYASTAGGVFASTDNGRNWQTANNGLTSNGSAPVNVRAFCTMRDTLYAATDGLGLCLTDNGGEEWRRTGPGTAQDWIYCVLAIGSRLYIGNTSGVHLSTNYGETWTSVAMSLPQGAVVSIVEHENMLYAATGSGVYRTLLGADGLGFVWQKVLSQSTLALINHGSTLLASTNPTGISISTNGGDEWRAIDASLERIRVNDLAIAGSTLYAGTNRMGVWTRPLGDVVSSVDESFTETAHDEELHDAEHHCDSENHIVNIYNILGEHLVHTPVRGLYYLQVLCNGRPVQTQPLIRE